MSCCGRGGSWFGNCGSDGSTNLDHTWSEGLQVCRSRTAISQHLNDAQRERNDSSNDTDSKVASMFVKARTFASAPMPDARLIIVTANAPVNASKTYNAPTLNLELITTVVTENMSALGEVPKPTQSLAIAGTSITDSARMKLSNTSEHILMTASAHSPAAARGFQQVLDITLHISFSIVIAFFQC